MRIDQLLLNNIRALLEKRGETQKDLARWAGHHETWLSKILREERGIRTSDLENIAGYFGLEVFQLFQPGITPYTERRRGDRRSGRDRRARDRRSNPSGVARLPTSLSYELPEHERQDGRRKRQLS